MTVSTCNTTIVNVSVEQMELIQLNFAWSNHPINSQEIIIEVQEDEGEMFAEIVPNEDSITGLVLCHL